MPQKHPPANTVVCGPSPPLASMAGASIGIAFSERAVRSGIAASTGKRTRATLIDPGIRMAQFHLSRSLFYHVYEPRAAGVTRPKTRVCEGSAGGPDPFTLKAIDETCGRRSANP